MVIAFIISLFPIITNATTGLTSIDKNLLELFELAGASRWQTLWKLLLPSSVPHLATGAKISSGLSVDTVVSDVKALRRFSAFLGEATPEVDAVAGLDRALLERYLAWLATAELGHGAREDAVTCLGMFFQALRQHGWDPGRPTTAVFFAGDRPPRPHRPTRHLAEHVMA